MPQCHLFMVNGAQNIVKKRMNKTQTSSSNQRTIIYFFFKFIIMARGTKVQNFKMLRKKTSIE